MGTRLLVWISSFVAAVFETVAAARSEERMVTVDQEMGFLARMSEDAGHQASAVMSILSALPQIPHDYAMAFSAILSEAPAWLHPALPIAIAAAVAALVLAVPALVDRIGGTWLRSKLDRGTRLGHALRWIAKDAAAFLVALALAALFVDLLFRRQFLIGKLAVTIVGAAVRWRLIMLGPQILFRPGQPGLRLIRVSDEKARLAVNAIGAVLAPGVLLASAMPILLHAGLPQRTAQATALIVGTLMAAGAAYGVYRFFDGIRGMAAVACEAVVALVWIAWSASATTFDFDIYHGVVWSLGIIAGTAGFDRLLAFAGQTAADGHPHTPLTPRQKLIIGSLRRIVLAVAGTVVAGLIAHLWLVDLLGLVDRENWIKVRQALITALAVLVAGYVLYEVFRAWSEARFGTMSSAGLRPSDEEMMPASRLSSVLPVLQGVLGAVIVATAVLLALSHVGINVGPLLAGAGIFGLAISFGSQALVRDIVAGLFYLFDDAFRVGEYIAAGKYKGTVERIALRSVRLRHQNGQIHTIPYGQLGAVTNFSRDYQTIKFNLRLARDTDVEKVRKLSKKLGQQMLEDPEIGKEFLQPFKMQGVADIQENALVCRFKFTVRPTRPTLVQRETLKRLYKIFTGEGVAFASNAVVVQTTGGPTSASPELTAQAAAGSAVSRADVTSGERLAS
jgi:small-conductance mechanosensitive channel